MEFPRPWRILAVRKPNVDGQDVERKRKQLREFKIVTSWAEKRAAEGVFWAFGQPCLADNTALDLASQTVHVGSVVQQGSQALCKKLCCLALVCREQAPYGGDISLL